MPHQVVFYHRETGIVLSVAKNILIRKRRAIQQYVPDLDYNLVKFYYELPEIKIIPGTDIVKSPSLNAPPAAVDKRNIPKNFAALIKSRHKLMTHTDDVEISFEGGMGDQLLESGAVLEAKKRYPGTDITCTVEKKHIDVVKRIQGMPEIREKGPSPQHKKNSTNIDMHTHYISDPRGGSYGKSSLYGASLGIQRVNTKARLKFSLNDYENLYKKLPQWIHTKKTKLFGIQIRSGSGHGKSWNTEPAERLANELIKKYGGCVFLFGAKNDFRSESDRMIRTDGRFTWLDTATLISILDHLTCIDSGCMHIARATKTKYTALWGGTSPMLILGEKAQEHDIRLELDCIDRECYDCPKKTCACMTGITPEMVMKSISTILPEEKTKWPEKQTSLTSTTSSHPLP